MGKNLNGKNIGKGFSQRSDGRYEARAQINGVKIDIYDVSLSRLKKNFEIEKAKVLKNVQGVRQNVTLSEWYNEWFEKCKSPQLKSDISRKSYDRKLRNTFIAFLGEKPLEKITQMNIQQIANELLSEKKYSERGVREALGILRECLESATINHIISVNPCQQIFIQNRNECQKERRVLEQWEQNLLLDEVKNCYYNEVYQFMLLTGVRIGELTGLQWNDIDWEKKLIKICRTMSTGYLDGKKIEELTTPKTANAYREIPFFGETEKILKTWEKKQNEYKLKLGDRWRANPRHGNLIFTNTMGAPISRYVIAHDLKRVEKNMILKEQSAAIYEGRTPRVIEHLHPHCFRHTFATRCFEKGMSPLIVQNIMGHSNYSTTISYTHILSEKRTEEIKKVGNFLE